MSQILSTQNFCVIILINILIALNFDKYNLGFYPFNLTNPWVSVKMIVCELSEASQNFCVNSYIIYEVINLFKTDVVVIGAGAVGCAVARELSKYHVNVIVVDKNEDVGGDASKSNSAIIHTGYDATPGTLESQLVVAANPMYDLICKDLDVPFKRIGAILPAITDE